MNNINDVYQYVSSILRKQYSGSMSNDQFNQWAGVAQQIHLLVKCGLPEDYKIDLGAPAPGQRRAVIAVRESAQEIEATNTISDEMYPFLAETTLFSTNNRFTIPPDYVRYRPSSYKKIIQGIDPTTGLTYTDWQFVPLEFVSGGDRNYRLVQYVKKPSTEYPIISYNNGELLVDADQRGQVIIPSINLIYVRLPRDPFRNATMNANDQPIYNPVGSVDFEFPKTEWIQISNRIISLWASSIRDTEIYQINKASLTTGE